MDGQEQQALIQRTMAFQSSGYTPSQGSGIAMFPGSNMASSQSSGFTTSQSSGFPMYPSSDIPSSQTSDMASSPNSAINMSSNSAMRMSQSSVIAASQSSGIPPSQISDMASSPTSAINMSSNSAMVMSQSSAITVSPSPDTSMENQEERPAQEVVQDSEADKSVSTDLALVEIKEEMIKEKIKCHGSFLSNGLYLLWTGEVYCDCILVVDIKELKCHSCVIASFSPLLQIKLNSSPQKTRLEGSRLFVVLDLTEVISFADLEPLIKYMYTGELNFKRNQVYDILKSAQFLGLKEIQQFCFIWMAQNITIKPTNVSFKPDLSEISNEDPQKTSDESAVNTSVNSAGNSNEKDDEFNFQDYIDILNSWQRAVTEDTNTNLTDSLGPSINMLKDSAAARMFTPQKDVVIPGRLEGGLKEEQEDGQELKSELLDAELNELLGQRKRRSPKRPIRFSAGEVDIKPRKMTSFDDYKPSDHIYVNFSNDRYLGSEAFVPKKKKVPTATLR